MTAQLSPSAQRLERSNIDTLFTALQQEGYQIIGPVIRDEAIVYDEVSTSDDLPIGWTDKQEPGSYRLEKRNDARLFGYVVGPWSWKRYIFPPREKLWSAAKTEKGFELIPSSPKAPKLAFLGVRACELQAISIQDKVFLGEDQSDPNYGSRRDPLFLIAVNCGQAGGTCFCASMGTGPKATSGFDLALTEILTDEEHYFLIEAGSEKGEKILAKIPHRQATAEEIQQGDDLVNQTTQQMGRKLDTKDIKDLLYRTLEHERWDEVAERCLSCANCTLVCPTCFCSDVQDVTDLTGEHAERWRQWDSCFNQSFSYIHGGNIRSSVKSRYRQWMTHKLATWIDQFGTSGCVGCGRCITWCPVGIDITEEAQAIRDSDSGSVPEDEHGKP
jgi:ferredoxin